MRLSVTAVWFCFLQRLLVERQNAMRRGNATAVLRYGTVLNATPCMRAHTGR